MRRASWYVLATIAAIGWAGAALLAWWLMTRLGWFGVMLIGIVVLFASSRPELTDDSPAASGYLLQRRYEQQFEGNAESRLAGWVARLERHRWLYLIRTIGIALALLGLNMFVTRQLQG